MNHRESYEAGIRVFALLFTRFMDLNGWSHPVMVSLARAALDDVSWLHSSQISGLRHGKLISPGPRTFLAIQVLNEALFRYKHEQRLIPNTTSSNNYQDPYVITENGEAPGLGWFMEVFTGQRVPSDIDVNQHSFTESDAEEISIRFGKLIRKLMVLNDYDPISDFDLVASHHYPAKDAERVAKLLDVLWNKDMWKPEELLNELPAITSMSAALSGPTTEDELLDHLAR